jgi:diguanylate cyclase (GGDEF)-like protein
MVLVFDVRSLFFFGAAAAFVSGAMLFMSRRVHAPSCSGLTWSAAAIGCYGMAMLLASLRGAVPDVLSYAVANTLATGAAALIHEGVRRLVGARPLPGLSLGTIFVLAPLQLWLGSGPEFYEQRVLLTSVLQGAFATASARLLYLRLGSPSEPPAPLRWAVSFCGLFAAGHLARAVMILTVGGVVTPDGTVTGPLQAMMPTLFALAPMLYALILISLVNGRIARELWALATIDTLTGVRTRRSFMTEARQALAEPPADRSAPVLLMLDLDRFKQINDRHGHVCGDLVLSGFAQLLHEIGPADAVIGRYGGEEFCMLLHAATPEAGQAHAQRLCDAVREKVFVSAEARLSVTVSIGVAGAPDGDTLEAMLLSADRRLYAAKLAGRDCIVGTDAAPRSPEARSETRGDTEAPVHAEAPVHTEAPVLTGASVPSDALHAPAAVGPPCPVARPGVPAAAVSDRQVERTT